MQQRGMPPGCILFGRWAGTINAGASRAKSGGHRAWRGRRWQPECLVACRAPSGTATPLADPRLRGLGPNQYSGARESSSEKSPEIRSTLAEDNRVEASHRYGDNADSSQEEERRSPDAHEGFFRPQNS